MKYEELVVVGMQLVFVVDELFGRNTKCKG